MTGVGGAGAVRAVQETFPSPVVDLLAVVTRMSDPVVLGVLVVAFYYARRDETGAFVFGVALGAVALTTGLKGAIRRPRPPSELAVGAVAESGYALPSGHALGSTVVLLALAEHLDVGSRRTRYAAAAVVVAVVAFSRVAVGVHYPVDVVAGVAFGALYLVLVSWDGPDAEVAFSAALTAAVVGVGLGSDHRLAACVGLPLGGYVGWHAVADRYDFADIARDPDAALVALLPAVALGVLVPAGPTVLAETAGYAAATATVFVAPHAAEAARRRRAR